LGRDDRGVGRAHQIDQLQRRRVLGLLARRGARRCGGGRSGGGARGRGALGGGRRELCGRRAGRGGGARGGTRARGDRRGRGRRGERAPAQLLAGDRQTAVGQAGQRRDHVLRVARDQLGAQQYRFDVFLGV